MAIRGHGKVFDAHFMQMRDEIFDAIADQRLATGHAYLANAKTQEDLPQALEFRPAQEFILRAVLFGVGRAAVNAAEVAAVGDRNPQVGDGTIELVVQVHDSRLARCLRAHSHVIQPQKPKPNSAFGVGRLHCRSPFSGGKCDLLSKRGRPKRFRLNPHLPAARTADASPEESPQAHWMSLRKVPGVGDYSAIVHRFAADARGCVQVHRSPSSGEIQKNGNVPTVLTTGPYRFYF